MLEAGSRLLPIEVKAARRVRPADAAAIAAFVAEHHKVAPFGLILYGGTEVVPLAERAVAVPLGCLWD